VLSTSTDEHNVQYLKIWCKSRSGLWSGNCSSYHTNNVQNKYKTTAFGGE